MYSGTRRVGSSIQKIRRIVPQSMDVSNAPTCTCSINEQPVEVRVIQSFSFWEDSTPVPILPDTKRSKNWHKIRIRGSVASLNGPSRFLAQAGEFLVDWPLQHCVPMKIFRLKDIRIDSHHTFRNG